MFSRGFAAGGLSLEVGVMEHRSSVSGSSQLQPTWKAPFALYGLSSLSSLLCSLDGKAPGMAVVKDVCWERFRRHLINVSVCILTTEHVITWNQIQFCHSRLLSFLSLQSGSLKRLTKVKKPSPKFLQILEKCIVPCSKCLQVSSVPWVLFLLEGETEILDRIPHTKSTHIDKNTYESSNKVSTGPFLHWFFIFTYIHFSAAHVIWLLTQNFKNSEECSPRQHTYENPNGTEISMVPAQGWQANLWSVPYYFAALFTIAKIWKQPKCPAAGEWIKQLWDIYTM